MSILGTVRNGQIVLASQQELPEGARVEVTVLPGEPTVDAPKRPTTTRDLLRDFAGSMTGLPADLARNHDAYLHGTPRS